MVQEDARIRQTVTSRLTGASLARIEIQRSANQIEVSLHTAKPGVVIGKGGAAVDQLRKDLEAMTGKKVKLNIEEIKQPELDAYLVAESIGEQITRRVSYRRAMKQSVMRAMRAALRACACVSQVASAVLKWPAPSGSARAACLCTPSAPTLITARCTPTPPTGA
jgi:small subunit ribosomal protein S3